LNAVAKKTFTPRKTPVQARSAATVDAILQGAIQVLVATGKERLTTTQVALRAGVSVGTLYQYFPNKSALLQACLRRHMETVGGALEQVCEGYKGRPLLEMATALIAAYLQAKMRNIRESTTLYAVSSDIDGAAISKAIGLRLQHALAELFATAKEGLRKEPEVVASMVFAALNGVSRKILEAKSPEREVGPLREELTVMIHAYLRTCVVSKAA
jgi:AcrR family transcriptional regulator